MCDCTKIYSNVIFRSAASSDVLHLSCSYSMCSIKYCESSCCYFGDKIFDSKQHLITLLCLISYRISVVVGMTAVLDNGFSTLSCTVYIIFVLFYVTLKLIAQVTNF